MLGSAARLYRALDRLPPHERVIEEDLPPRTILDELARLHSADIVLPTAQYLRRELRIRCVVRPDKPQAQLLDRFGLRLPERLPRPADPAQR